MLLNSLLRTAIHGLDILTNVEHTAEIMKVSSQGKDEVTFEV